MPVKMFFSILDFLPTFRYALTMDEQITISKKEYDRLLADSNFLSALETVGVDNWEGYSEARKMLREEENDK